MSRAPHTHAQVSPETGPHTTESLECTDIPVETSIAVDVELREASTNILQVAASDMLIAQEEITPSQAISAATVFEESVEAIPSVPPSMDNANALPVIDTLKKQCSDFLYDLREQVTENSKIKQMIAERDVDLRMAREEIERLRKRVKSLENEVAKKEAKLGEQSSLLKIRGAELNDAQTYLMIQDKFVGADIVHMVEFLNAEIHQTTATVMDKASQLYCGYTADVGNEYSRIRKNLDIDLLGTLRRLPPEQDRSTIVEITLQHAFVKICCDFIDSWYLGEEPTGMLSDTLHQMYQTICENGRIL
jgi:hypothetical protein